MNFHIMTLFPEMVMSVLSESIIGRAISNGYINAEAVNIRDYANNKHNKVDDYTYGGGAGMLMQADPVYRCYEAIMSNIAARDNGPGKAARAPRVVYLTPQGSIFDQNMASEYALEDDLILLCGHYEGIDERVIEEIVTDCVSVGDYVLTGGELAAMIVVDAVSRLCPGVLSNSDSPESESFSDGLLEYPQYSRPEVWHGRQVPEVLLSGDHEKVAAWRHEMALSRTMDQRFDLYRKYVMSHPEEFIPKKPRRRKKKTD